MKDNQKIKLDKIIDLAQGVHLSVEEKISMRNSLSKIINTTPTKSPFWSFTFVRSHYYVPAFASVLILITGGSGLLAQNSLPGDILYSMKVNVNEKMESFLALTPQASAEVFAVQANRRLEEAEVLAVKGEITLEQDKAIKDSFSAKVTSLNDSFTKLQENGESEAARTLLKKFDTNIKKRVDILTKVSTTTDNAKKGGDIVKFIKTKYSEENSKKESQSIKSEKRSKEVQEFPKPPETGTEMNTPPESTIMMAASAPATTSDSNINESIQVQDDNKGSSIPEIKIRWSWSEDN